MLKNNMGLDPEYKAPIGDDRLLNIQSITIEFKDHKVPAVLPYSTDAEQKAAANTVLTIKEGTEFRVKVTFRAQHYIVSGLTLRSSIKSGFTTVAEDENMLGSFNPTTGFKDVFLPRNGWNEAPSGMIARGTYVSTMLFKSDDNQNLLTISYKTKIDKNFA
jgi:Rho GDP-dissociation inhibitor